VDQSLEAWPKVLARTMESEGFAALNAQLMEQYLNAVGPLRTTLRTTGEEFLRTVNLPSRAQVTGLASQLVALDARLEALEERLDGLDGLAGGVAAIEALLRPAGAEARPPRAKKGAGSRRRRDA
jgi:hypothetical protein